MPSAALATVATAASVILQHVPDLTIVNHINTDEDWLAGVFGIGGVLVGGLLTAGVDVWKDWRAGRARARVGGRLLRRQLMTVASSVATAVRKGTWGPTRSFATSAWDDHASAFALSLSPEEWDVVANAIVNIRRTGQPTIDVHAPQWQAEVVPLEARVVAVLRPIYEDCRRAYAALHRVSQLPPHDQELPMLEALPIS